MSWLQPLIFVHEVRSPPHFLLFFSSDSLQLILFSSVLGFLPFVSMLLLAYIACSSGFWTLLQILSSRPFQSSLLAFSLSVPREVFRPPTTTPHKPPIDNLFFHWFQKRSRCHVKFPGAWVRAKGRSLADLPRDAWLEMSGIAMGVVKPSCKPEAGCETGRSFSGQQGVMAVCWICFRSFLFEGGVLRNVFLHLG